MLRAAAVLAVVILAQITPPDTTQPWQGVRVIVRSDARPRPVRMHIARIALDTPGVRFTVSAPAGTRETIRQTTVDFLRQQRAQLAINAHFFLPFPSSDREAWVIGPAASNGWLYSSFEHPEQRFAILDNAPALNIDRHNRARIVHRDRADSSGFSAVEDVEWWNAVAGSAQVVSDGTVSIPEYGRHLAPGAGYSGTRSWYEVPNARTMIGLSRDSRVLTLFTVDRAGGSEGLTVGEAAAVLVRDYEVWNALNLDGGGSTSIAWTNPATGEAELLNTSSDNPAGRAVASSLAVFAPRRQ